MSNSPGNIFAAICEETRRDLIKRKERIPQDKLDEQVSRAPAPRSISDALVSDRVAVIAEFKRASPSRGDIRPDADAAGVASIYAKGGASAISVLTNGPYFKGRVRDLASARAVCELPVLRKDFILDSYQIDEARSISADAVLLIVAALTDAELSRLIRLTEALGMDALVEVHDEEEVKRALESGAKLVGINNRDLKTFETSLETTFELREKIPEGVIVVSESGIRTRQDVERLAQAGVDAILVGEALMLDPDITPTLQSLVGVPHL